MSFTKVALMGAALIVGTISANAADVYDGSIKDQPTDYYSPPIGWGGFYIGASIGSTFDDSLIVDGVDIEIEEALTGGVYVGYNWQKYNNWLFGIEADVNFTDDEIDDDGDQLTSVLSTFRGRVGYTRGNTLVYATAGLGLLSLDTDFGQEDDPVLGWVAGGGVEHKFNPKWSLGAEALYHEFNSDLEVGDGELERDFWTIKARLSYHLK